MPKPRLILAALAAASLAAPAAAVAADETTVHEWTLENGLEVVHVETGRVPAVSVQVWYRVGTRDDPPDRTGLARLFERLLFEGSTHVPPGDHVRLIDEVGGRVNAFVTEDVVVVQNTIATQYLDFTLRLEADRMRGLVIRQKGVTAAATAAVEDRRQKVEGSPVGGSFVHARARVFAGHPYAATPNGEEADLLQITADEARKFYDAYFVPNNAVLVIAGAVSQADARAAVEQAFASIPKGAKPPAGRRGEAIAPPTKPTREEIGQAGLGVVMRAYPLPPVGSDDLFALRIAASVLADGDDARLLQALVGPGKPGSFATCQVDAHQDGGLFLAIAIHEDPRLTAAVETGLTQELDRLREKGITDEELARARRRLGSVLAAAIEETTGLGFQAGASKILRGDAKAWLGDWAKYQAVTSDDVRRVATATFAPERATTVIVLPIRGRR